MRLVFEAEDNLGVYESTMSEFGHLVGLLVALAQHSNSQYELKYNLKIPIGWSQLKAELSTDIKEVILKCLEVEEHKRITAK